jgi:hypothetical protein
VSLRARAYAAPALTVWVLAAGRVGSPDPHPCAQRKMSCVVVSRTYSHPAFVGVPFDVAGGVAITMSCRSLWEKESHGGLRVGGGDFGVDGHSPVLVVHATPTQLVWFFHQSQIKSLCSSSVPPSGIASTPTQTRLPKTASFGMAKTTIQSSPCGQTRMGSALEASKYGSGAVASTMPRL